MLNCEVSVSLRGVDKPTSKTDVSFEADLKKKTVTTFFTIATIIIVTAAIVYTFIKRATMNVL